MKLTYTTIGTRLVLELDVKDTKQAFDAIAHFDEIFAVRTCPNCGGQDHALVHRTPGGNDYRELKCKNPDCGYEFDFSTTKEGGRMYPKSWREPYRRDDSQHTPPEQQQYAQPPQQQQTNHPAPEGQRGQINESDIPF
jgi:hypothetical protein